MKLIKNLLAIIGFASITVGLMIAICFFTGILGAFLWPYILNHWLAFMGYSYMVVWWQGFLLGLIPYIGEAQIPIALFTFVFFLIF